MSAETSLMSALSHWWWKGYPTVTKICIFCQNNTNLGETLWLEQIYDNVTVKCDA